MSENSLKSLDFFMFVKEEHVSYLIGSKGLTISTLSKESSTKIIVMPPIVELNYRAVKITGTHQNICQASRLVQSLLAKKLNTINYFKQKNA